MARFSPFSRGKKKDDRPEVKDDFIYDEPEEASSDIASDTPEEALRKLRGDAAVPDLSSPEDASASRAGAGSEEDFRDRLGDF
ncbi:MAG: hypothetical protein J6J41_02855, partial [Clostridia bacterium]|nr:hypothetical protein [Clostridia bacterium]